MQFQIGFCPILQHIVEGVPRLTEWASGLGYQGGPDYVLSSQTKKLMAATKFSDYLGLKHYKKAKKLNHFIHLDLATRPRIFFSYHTISPTGNSGYQLKKNVLVM